MNSISGAIALDSSIFISYAKGQNQEKINCPKTGHVIEHPHVRVKQLLINIELSKNLVLIPAIVLAEILVKPSPEIDILLNEYNFLVWPFDQLSAKKTAEIEAKSPRNKASNTSRGAIKADRQIIGSCLACGVSALYTLDHNLYSSGISIGLNMKSISEVTISDELAQTDIIANLQYSNNDSIAATEEDTNHSITINDDGTPSYLDTDLDDSNIADSIEGTIEADKDEA